MKLSHLTSLLFTIVGTIALVATGALSAPSGSAPRQLVESLYSSSGVLPIKDLIVELESYAADPATGALSITSKDKICFKAPNKLRIDALIQDPGGPLDQKLMIVIRDGVTAWQYVSNGQYPVKKNQDKAEPTLNLPFGVQKYTIDNNKQYKGIGAKEINGVQAVGVEISNPQNAKDKKIVYIDTKRLCPVRLEMTRAEKSGDLKIRIDYKDVKALSDKRFFPFTIERYENNTLTKIFKYKAVQANVGLNDSLFQQMERFVR